MDVAPLRHLPRRYLPDHHPQAAGARLVSAARDEALRARIEGLR